MSTVVDISVLRVIYLSQTLFIHFTALFDFAVSDRYSYEKIHTASLGTDRWVDLNTRHYIKPTSKGSGLDVVVTCAEMRPSHLANGAFVISSTFTLRGST